MSCSAAKTLDVGSRPLSGCRLCWRRTCRRRSKRKLAPLRATVTAAREAGEWIRVSVTFCVFQRWPQWWSKRWQTQRSTQDKDEIAPGPTCACGSCCEEIAVNVVLCCSGATRARAASSSRQEKHGDTRKVGQVVGADTAAPRTTSLENVVSSSAAQSAQKKCGAL